MALRDNCGCGPVEGTSCGPCAPLEVELGHSAVPRPGLKGEREKVIVSASARVMTNEFVQKVREYKARGMSMRFAGEGTKVLTAEELENGRVGVVFAQGGQTKFKLLAYADNALALGNTLTIVEDEELTAAELVSIDPGQCAVLYNADAAGQITYITLDERKAELDFTDVWDVEDPANIVACALGDGRVLACGMRQTPSHAGEAWVRAITRSGYTSNGVFHPQVRLEPAARVDVPNDTDEYAGAWDMTRVDASTVVLTCFAAYKQPISFAVLDVDYQGAVHTRMVAGGKYASSLPCTQVVALGGHGVFALVYGVCWYSKAGNMTKTSLAVEVWSLTRYAAELLVWALEDTRYGLGLGGVSACWSGAGCAITYFGDRIDQEETKVQAQTSLFDFTADGPVGGPPIPQGALNAYCRAVPINLRWTLRVDQREGCGYVQLLEAVERVVPAAGGSAGQGPVYGRYVHGLALREGGPEEEITITVPKSATNN